MKIHQFNHVSILCKAHTAARRAMQNKTVFGFANYAEALRTYLKTYYNAEKIYSDSPVNRDISIPVFYGRFLNSLSKIEFCNI